MKKITTNLLKIGAISTLAGIMLAACGSGSTSCQACNVPATVSTTPVQVPSIQGGSGAANGSPAIISTTQLAVPIGSSYNTYSLPATVTAGLAGVNLADVVVTSNAGNILLTIPSTNGGPTTVFILSVPAQANAQIKAATTLAAIEIQIPATYTISTNILSTSTTGIVFGGTDNTGAKGIKGIITYAAAGSLTIPEGMAGCGATGQPSTVQAASYNGSSYLALGTVAGEVCVFDFQGQSAQNLSSQAPARYTKGYVNSFGFYPSSKGSLYGFWNVSTSSAANSNSQVYQVTGSGTTATNIVGSSFWNTTTSAQQNSTSGTTKVTFSNVPSSVNSSYTDGAGNTYVGSNTGSVYKLSLGSTTWANTQLPGIGAGAVTITTNGQTTGATATAMIGGATQVFALN